MKALEEGYHLSSPLAHVLVYGSIALLGQFGAFGLNDLARHNRIEHDASLVHDDTPARDEYAPLAPDATLIKQFLEQVGEDHILSIEDLARHRVWRESQCPALNSLHSEIAKGEMAIAFGLFTPPGSEKQGIPVDMLRTWFTEERLPDGWKPSHTQGLLETMRTSQMIKEAMEKIELSGEDVAPPSVRLEHEHQVEHEQKA
jgi:Peroxidase, family 2